MSFQDKQSNVRPKLVLFCGLPGSGKTTLARKLEKELPAVRLCPDEWMADLGIDLFDDAVRNKLEIRLWKSAQELLKLGQHVILENGLWSKAERDDKRRDAAELDIEVELHHLDVPFEELLRRLEIRNASGAHGTVPLTRAQMEGYTKLFQAPDKSEYAQFARAFVYDAQGKRQDISDVAYHKVVQNIRSLPKPANRPLIIAISGFGGSGKTTLANKLKQQLKDAEIVTIDSFSNHEWRRNEDWDNFDRDLFAKQILKRAKSNKFPLVYKHEPWPGYVANPAVEVPKATYLIVEGCSIFHSDLLEYYDFKIWMDCPLEEATKRAMWRDRHVHKDEHDDLWLNVWMPNERDFLAKYRPDLAADITIRT